MARRAKKPPKPKVIKYEIAPREPLAGTPLDALAMEAYRTMDELVARWHEELTGAKIVIAWMRGLKPNADDQLPLGKAIKQGDLPRQLHQRDFILGLNREAFGVFTADRRRALIDHELCHMAVKLDKAGEPKKDALGRIIYRVRKHDIEEFRAVVSRFGLWKADLQAFVDSIDKAAGKAKAEKKAGRTEEPAGQAAMA